MENWLPYQFLKKITSDFSEERKLGSGAFGSVYKGVDENGKIMAVKVFRNVIDFDHKQFTNEYQNLAKLDHRNIVRLVGYCNETKRIRMYYEGEPVIALELHLALCMEYAHNGSLSEHISDENQELNWHIRYKIIKGICEGLNYLHNGSGNRILHLDLKPDNILLDKNMVPKIADFGLSRLFGEKNTIVTAHTIGTIGYLPPEYIEHQIISKAFDVFSLGVIITKIMAGSDGYQLVSDMAPKTFIEHVYHNWREKLYSILRPRLLDVVCQQVKTCIEIALKCLNRQRSERPAIQEIICELESTERMIDVLVLQTEQISHGPIETELLDIYPSELRFIFEPNKKIWCTVNLTNKTEDDVYYLIRPKNPDRYGREVCGHVKPRYTLPVTLVMEAQEQAPSNGDEIHIVMLREFKLSTIFSSFDSVFQNITEMGGSKASLTCVICDPNPAGEATRYQGPLYFDKNFGDLISIDTHPKEPWICTSHDNGYLCIFKKKAQGSTIAFEIIHSQKLGLSSCCLSVKFIPSRQWVVSGDSEGDIRVHAYVDGFDEVIKFKAHRGAVRSLDVHPTQPLLLSASDDCLIRLWNCDMGWVCAREFPGHWSAVRQVMFNPWDSNTFASISGKYTSFWPGSIKIWRIDSSNHITDWITEGSCVACYMTGDSDRQHMVIGREGKKVKIWDMESGSYVRALDRQSISNADVVAVACHSTLPILVTGTTYGHVSLWNTTCYSLNKVYQFTQNAVKGFGFVDIDGFRSCLVVGYSDVIELVEIDRQEFTAQQ